MEQKEKRYPLSEEKKVLLRWRRRGDTTKIAETLKVSCRFVDMALCGDRQHERVWTEFAKIVTSRIQANREISATAFQVLVETGLDELSKKLAGKITDLDLEEIRKAKQSESAALFEELTEGGRKLSEQIQTIKQNLEAENRAKT